MTANKFLTLIFILFASPAQATSSTASPVPATIHQSTVPNLIKIPRVTQSTNYTCGVAASLAILGYYGYEMTEADLSKVLKSHPDYGTPPSNIISYFKNQRFDISARQHMSLEDLMREIDRGRPTLIVMQAWADDKNIDWKNEWDSGHYVVAIGHDQKNIYFMDPFTIGQYTYIPKDEFMLRWHDQESPDKRYVQWGMTVWKKGFTPNFNQDEIKYLP